jgi:hypothetical protein
MAGTIIGFTFFITEHIKTELRTNLVKQYTEQEQIIAHEVSVVLHAKITSLIDELNLISNIPDVQNGNSIVCNTELKKLVDTLNVKIGNIGRVDKNGVFRCTLNGGLLGSKAEKLGPYINDIFNDPEHKKVMSRAIMPKGVTTYLSAIHVPVYDNKGNFDGTLGGAIYFDKIYEDYLKDILISKNGRVILIDDDGTILSHPVKDFIGKNIKSEYIQKLNNNEHSFDKILSEN